MFRALIKFGIHIGDVDFAVVACRLYRDALAPGTKKQHQTGVRHLQRFIEKYPCAPLPSDEFSPPSRMSNSLVFFAAYLFELPSINAYSTIRNYISHVRQFYLKKGHPPKKLDSPLLKAVMRGVKRCMPPKADSRVAFLLIHYRFPNQFKNTNSRTVKKSIAAVSFGFFAMLSFHTYNKLCLECLRLVLKGGREVTPSKVGLRITVNLLASNSIHGFYFIFDDKFHPGARAYYCKVRDLHRSLRRLCPLKHLKNTVELS